MDLLEHLPEYDGYLDPRPGPVYFQPTTPLDQAA